MGRPMDPEVVDLVERHLDLVTRIVAVMAARTPRHVERDELRRAGALGLVEAAARFDATRGIAFAHFAAPRVRGAILDAMRSTDWAPRSVRATARRLDLVEGALLARLGRRPTDEELARESDVDIDRIAKVRSMVAAARIDTLDRTIPTDDGEVSLVDVVADVDQPDPIERLERCELVDALRSAVAALPERQRRVIVGYFLEGRRSDELAAELRITESRVSQLRKLGIAELRRSIVGGDRSLAPILGAMDRSVPMHRHAESA